MTPERALVLLLAFAVVLSIARLAWSHLRASNDARPARWRTLLLAALTAVSGGLLYRTLQPPALPVAGDTLVVLTADAGGLETPSARTVIALPEADRLPAHAIRMPDLATALRLHPEARTLVVVGAGLETRDREAVDGRALQFVPAALPAGIVRLGVPQDIAAGARFQMEGQVTGVDAPRLSLRDPAGRVVDTATPGDDGRFRLAATARGAGAALFEIVLQDAEDAEIERLQVPVVVDDAAPLRVLLLAASPNPEVRALRRWAEDAGMTLRWRAGFGGGAGVGDAPALDAAGFAAQDLVLIEARAWDGLGAGARAALLTAVRDGLGVLIHAPQPPSAALRAWLRGAGLPVEIGNARNWRPDAGPADVARLRAWLGPGSDDAPFDPLLAGEAPPQLSRLPLSGGLPIDDADADSLRWQAVGLGRIGLVTVADSWQLPLAGRADLHAGMWSAWSSVLARAGAAPALRIEGAPRVGARFALCGLQGDARIGTPDGATILPVNDPEAGGCAGVWPRSAGWHRIVQGGGETPVFVRPEDEARSLHARTLRDDTQALVRTTALQSGAPTATRPGSPWPWALAWLLVSAALWALGRARIGRRAASGDTGLA